MFRLLDIAKQSTKSDYFNLYSYIKKVFNSISCFTSFPIFGVASLFILAWCVVVVGEGNGTPLQYFCLENPMDGGAW